MNTITSKTEFKQKSKKTLLTLLKFAPILSGVFALIGFFLPLIRENYDALNREGFSLARLWGEGHMTWGCWFFLLCVVPFVAGLVVINIFTARKIKGKTETEKAAKIIFITGIAAAALTFLVAVASFILQMPFTAAGALGMANTPYYIGIGAYFFALAGIVLAAIVLGKALILTKLMQGKLGFDKIALCAIFGKKKPAKKTAKK